MLFSRTILCATCLLPAVLLADPQSDAKLLKDEAVAILKENSSKAATPDEYATCIMKLEKAQAMLDSANENDTPLAQEVSSSLFWARRFSNMDVIKSLQKLRGNAPLRKTTPPPAAPVVAAKGPAPEPPEVLRGRAADKAFAEAQVYASKSTDDYATALRFFQMAGEHAGTDAALKALELAREAQQKYLAAKGDVSVTAAVAAAETYPDSPEMAQVKQADSSVKNKRFEEAIKQYRTAIAQKDAMFTRRRLAKALYLRAQQMREELKPKFEAHAKDYQAASAGAWMRTPLGPTFNPDDPNYLRSKREGQALWKESDASYKNFQEAEIEFKAILKAADNGRDFEAAAYVGLCQCVRPFFKMQGKNTLDAVIKDYTPANDLERTLYEFCKAEIERIRYGR